MHVMFHHTPTNVSPRAPGGLFWRDTEGRAAYSDGLSPSTVKTRVAGEGYDTDAPLAASLIQAKIKLTGPCPSGFH